MKAWLKRVAALLLAVVIVMGQAPVTKADLVPAMFDMTMMNLNDAAIPVRAFYSMGDVFIPWSVIQQLGGDTRVEELPSGAYKITNSFDDTWGEHLVEPDELTVGEDGTVYISFLEMCHDLYLNPTFDTETKTLYFTQGKNMMDLYGKLGDIYSDDEYTMSEYRDNLLIFGGSQFFAIAGDIIKNRNFGYFTGGEAEEQYEAVIAELLYPTDKAEHELYNKATQEKVKFGGKIFGYTGELVKFGTASMSGPGKAWIDRITNYMGAFTTGVETTVSDDMLQYYLYAYNVDQIDKGYRQVILNLANYKEHCNTNLINACYDTIDILKEEKTGTDMLMEEFFSATKESIVKGALGISDLACDLINGLYDKVYHLNSKEKVEATIKMSRCLEMQMALEHLYKHQRAKYFDAADGSMSDRYRCLKDMRDTMLVYLTLADMAYTAASVDKDLKPAAKNVHERVKKDREFLMQYTDLEFMMSSDIYSAYGGMEMIALTEGDYLY